MSIMFLYIFGFHDFGLPVGTVWILNTRHCRTTRGHGETARRGRERSEVGGQRSEDRGRKADDGQLTLRLV